MDSLHKSQFLLSFYWIHYAYVLGGGDPVIASDTQIAAKGNCASNTCENPLSDFIFLIYKKFCSLLQAAFLNASCLELT